jgi:hypothetical protein
MAWRPNDNLIKGALDNTLPGKVTGWIEFIQGKGQKPLRVKMNLKGDFREDIKGKVLLFVNPTPQEKWGMNGNYMEGFAKNQTGKVGDITAGFPLADGSYAYVDYPYIEWVSNANWRVVLELDPEQVAVSESMPQEKGEKKLKLAINP